jgi:hypothetical protein
MKYQVIFQSFTERHYIKSFAKKYKNAWDKTLDSILTEFRAVDVLFTKSIAKIISVSADNEVKICKTEFKILGTNISRHASGYRCIIAMHRSSQTVHVLLVYSKGDTAGNNETTWWQNLLKDTYPEYKNIL